MNLFALWSYFVFLFFTWLTLLFLPCFLSFLRRWVAFCLSTRLAHCCDDTVPISLSRKSFLHSPLKYAELFWPVVSQNTVLGWLLLPLCYLIITPYSDQPVRTHHTLNENYTCISMTCCVLSNCVGGMHHQALKLVGAQCMSWNACVSVCQQQYQAAVLFCIQKKPTMSHICSSFQGSPCLFVSLLRYW